MVDQSVWQAQKAMDAARDRAQTERHHRQRVYEMEMERRRRAENNRRQEEARRLAAQKRSQAQQRQNTTTTSSAPQKDYMTAAASDRDGFADFLGLAGGAGAVYWAIEQQIPLEWWGWLLAFFAPLMVIPSILNSMPGLRDGLKKGCVLLAVVGFLAWLGNAGNGVA